MPARESSTPLTRVVTTPPRSSPRSTLPTERVPPRTRSLEASAPCRTRWARWVSPRTRTPSTPCLHSSSLPRSSVASCATRTPTSTRRATRRTSTTPRPRSSPPGSLPRSLPLAATSTTRSRACAPRRSPGTSTRPPTGLHVVCSASTWRRSSTRSKRTRPTTAALHSCPPRVSPWRALPPSGLASRRPRRTARTKSKLSWPARRSSSRSTSSSTPRPTSSRPGPPRRRPTSLPLRRSLLLTTLASS
mmetsp:Transcript_8645/g.36025  ORF Transcript_8645/g.36025 Transcript_8645/m.36025 type:complete len:247 (+) Transcript_8645:1965-2705(+)